MGRGCHGPTQLSGDTDSVTTHPPPRLEQPLESSPLSASTVPHCRCDDRTAKKLMTHFSHLGSANHTRALGELEACVTMLVEQLGSQGCDPKTLRTPEEEVSGAPEVGSQTNG